MKLSFLLALPHDVLKSQCNGNWIFCRRKSSMGMYEDNRRFRRLNWIVKHKLMNVYMFDCFSLWNVISFQFLLLSFSFLLCPWLFCFRTLIPNVFLSIFYHFNANKFDVKYFSIKKSFNPILQFYNITEMVRYWYNRQLKSYVASDNMKLLPVNSKMLAVKLLLELNVLW